MGFEPTSVKVRYSDGVFVPIAPVSLREGTEVDLPLPQEPLSEEEWRAILKETRDSWGDFEFEEPYDPPLQPEKIFD
ncbi:DUF104 domain-containing protein [bacterium]|nr:MAG: DUF104 domain-containing protein [bacterium]